MISKTTLRVTSAVALMSAGLVFGLQPLYAAESKWSVKFTVNKNICAGKPSVITFKDGKISGEIEALSIGAIAKIKGTVDNEGNITGKITRLNGRFEGKVKGNSGSGTWKGALGCKGTMTFRKL